MSSIWKLLVSLGVQADTPFIVRRNVFEGEGDRYALKRVAIFEDDFNDNFLDPAKWNETETGGGSVVEQNQRLEVTGDSSWDHNGVVSDDSFALTKGLTFEFEINHVSGNLFGGTVSSSSGLDFFLGVGVHISSNEIYLFLDGAGNATGSYVSTGNVYTFYLEFIDPGWKLYVQSDTDGTYSDKTLVQAEGSTGSSDPGYVQFQALSSMVWCDNISVSSYPTTSPSPGAVWTPTGGPCTVKVKTATNHRFKDGVVIEDLSGADDDLVVQYKNAVDGGSLGPARTLSAFREQGDIEVTSSPEDAKSISSITRIGNLATVTCIGHGFSTGDGIIGDGSDQDEYNEPKAGIQVLTDDIYTFNVKGSPITPATGTMTCKRHNAVKVVPLFKSDGIDESMSGAWLVVDVVFPEGTAGGGGLQSINGGILNV